MQSAIQTFTLPLALGALSGALTLAVGIYLARRTAARARLEAEDVLRQAGEDAAARRSEALVEVREASIKSREEADRRDAALAEREQELGGRQADLDRRQAALDAEAGRLAEARSALERDRAGVEAALARAREAEAQAQLGLQKVAGLSPEEARRLLIAEIEQEARAEAALAARRIEDEARESAERTALDLVIQATERVSVQDVVESTVSFIELPSDEMKGRIIGKEGRNIRALEMATGIDLVVDDTPRSILISSFDPWRREVARIAIERLVEDGRIHPARIEEVVEKVSGELEEIVEQRGHEAAFGLGISDLHPKLARLVGRMRFHTSHGQNLLQHATETALIAAHLAEAVGASVEICTRAGLLHELGQVDDRPGVTGHPIQLAAELAGKLGENEDVVHAIQALHADVKPRTVEALLLNTASRLSDNRPGARKENLAVFVERLRRLEEIATRFEGVSHAFAVKAGKEIRVIVDTARAGDGQAYALSKKIARALEKELNYPGQIKVSVIRETRAVRYAV